jgi:hypothetical protein
MKKTIQKLYMEMDDEENDENQEKFIIEKWTK